VLLVDAVQRIWRGFRNQGTQGSSYPETALPSRAPIGHIAMSSLLVNQAYFPPDEQTTPPATEPALPELMSAHSESSLADNAHFLALMAAADEIEVAETSLSAPLPEPESLDSLQLRAKEARAQADWHQAAILYEEISLHQPEEVAHATACAEAHRNGGDCLAADAVLQRFHSENGESVEIAVHYALNAQAEQDWQEAYQRWHDLRLAFPGVAAGWAAETAMLLILGRIDDAENVVQLGASRIPGNMDILAQYAGVCIARNDWIAALHRISEVEVLGPLLPSVAAHIGGMRETVLEQINALPTAVLLEHAAGFDQRHDWNMATALWHVIHGRNSRNARAAIGYGQALRERGELDEADRILAAALPDNADNQELLANYAQVPAARLDWSTAALRWQHILERFPDTPALWAMAATAYREAGLFEPADLLLSRAIAVEPDRLDLRVQYAMVADKQENWTLAIERWDTAHRLWPDEPNIRNSRGDAIWQEASQRLELGEHSPTVSRSPAETATADMKQVALQFEGLGDNCEFGIVQRHFGADPIGLFRFAAISAETMIALLAEKFDRLGDPGFTRLSLTTGNEYLVRDARGLYHLHSFVRKGSINEEKFLHQQVVRLTYLKRKILEDLEDGKKIFVHKSSHSRIDDATAIALHDAIGQFGDNILLIIRLIEDDRAAGTIVELRPGLLVGHVSTMYTGDGYPIDFGSWRCLLLAACEYRNRIATPLLDASVS
jgi:tetratricopeptide (TPR) repeat protein